VRERCDTCGRFVSKAIVDAAPEGVYRHWYCQWDLDNKKRHDDLILGRVERLLSKETL
jgi:hypothetical protein